LKIKFPEQKNELIASIYEVKRIHFPDIHGSPQEYLVQVYITDEFQTYKDEAVPVFQHSFFNSFKDYSIYLPENEYIVVFRDQDGNKILEIAPDPL